MAQPVITLGDGTNVCTLSPDLYWSDENNWAPVEQSIQRSISGAVIVSTAARLAGRPITLTPEDQNSAWTQRTTLDTLRTWAAVPGREMVLTLRGTTYNVIFRHHDGQAIEAAPIKHCNDVQPTDFYTVTLRFMEV